jgi:hypothetical protein
MESPTIQNILQEHYGTYERSHKIQDHVRAAVQAMLNCRTEALGGHKQICPDGHYTRIWYNSCKHRSCPQCAYIQTRQWLQAQQERLLGCDHYHGIFTIPHDLNDLWRYNMPVMANLLFRTVKKVLFELLADPRYLGATPAVILALHTWGQSLILHPHIHCLISGGGWHEGEWKGVKNGFLVPVVVLMERFRAEFVKVLRRNLDTGELLVPPDRDRAGLEAIFTRVEKRKWNVHIRERYPHGEGVANYLARYLKGGPIGNSRLLPAPEGKVRFSYINNHDKDEAGRGKPDILTLPAERFLQRLLQHIPASRMQMVRSYGLYASAKAEQLDQCRQWLGQAPVEKAQPKSWQDECADSGEAHPECCPVCGKRLIRAEEIPAKKAKRKLPAMKKGLDPLPGLRPGSAYAP